MRDSEVLDQIADYIQVFGWTGLGDEGTGWFVAHGEPACLEGAGKIVCGQVYGEGEVFTNWHCRLKIKVDEYLTGRFPDYWRNDRTGRVIAFCWNDAPERTAAEVIEVLRATALIEAAKERADVAEVVAS